MLEFDSVQVTVFLSKSFTEFLVMTISDNCTLLKLSTTKWSRKLESRALATLILRDGIEANP